MSFEYNSQIVRYGEISLKGKNRAVYEKRLKDDIKRHFRSFKIKHTAVELKRGRLYVRGTEGEVDLSKILGVFSYSPAIEIEKSFDTLSKAASEFIPHIKKVSDFRVSCQRVDKTFPMTSVQVEREIGALLFSGSGTSVKLKDPECEVMIEIGETHIYIFLEKVAGYGGFPFGTAGKLVSLVSGGIDSPVSTFLMMKRGVEPVLLYYRISDSDEQKVIMLKQKLEEFSAGRELKLVVIDRNAIFDNRFNDLYSDRRFNPYVCVICKYLMHRTAGEIAREQGALGIVTGDNLAQVASQTLKNMFSYHLASEMPVYSPLIGFEKHEIIALAKKIGTFELSCKESEECVPPSKPKTGVDYKLFRKVLSQAGF